MTKIVVKNLRDYPQYIRKVSKWIYDEWGKNSGRVLADSVYRTKHCLNKDKIPMMLIAFIGKTLVGTVSLWQNDLKSRQDLTPYIAALYVDKKYRGKGVGMALQKESINQARKMGYEYLHLITDHKNYYEKLGWKLLDRAPLDNGDKTRLYQYSLNDERLPLDENTVIDEEKERKFLDMHDRKYNKVFDKIYEIKKNNKFLFNDEEVFNIYKMVESTGKLKGAIAEVGVYEGNSAEVIEKYRGKRKLYLFDTFEGLPDIVKEDKGILKKGQFKSVYEKVVKRFSRCKNVDIVKGVFPKSAGKIKGKFSFVHLDVDTYKGTKESLEYFYKRMEKSGVIMCHDYINFPGVKKAVDDFFKNKPEIVIPLYNPKKELISQCFIVKC